MKDMKDEKYTYWFFLFRRFKNWDPDKFNWDDKNNIHGLSKRCYNFKHIWKPDLIRRKIIKELSK